MGMAASQARYLSLTARKSNVEYQGQQINQQRTTLANESSNLYNQMLSLSVPVPPGSSDFYKSSYSLVDNNTNYKFSEFKTTGANPYAIITWENEEADVFKGADLSSSSYIAGSTLHIGGTGTDTNTNVSMLTNPRSDEKFMAALGHAGPTSTFYKTDGTLDDVYTYRTYDTANSAWVTNYLSKTAYDGLVDNATSSNPSSVRSYSVTDGTATESRKVFGTFSHSSSDRLTTFKVTDGQGILTDNASYNLTVSREYDEKGYEDAYQDYLYQKDVYDKTVANINSQTQLIQQKDKTLELQLDQLDTEQNAIQTEMESVQKVIEKNVEDTFNIFA